MLIEYPKKTFSMNDNLASFSGGAVLNIIGHGKWIILLQVNMMPGETAKVWAIKIASTFILGVVGGAAGLVTKFFFEMLKKKFNRK